MMVYTTDGTTPTTNSLVYGSPIALPLGGTCRQAAFLRRANSSGGLESFRRLGSDGLDGRGCGQSRNCFRRTMPPSMRLMTTRPPSGIPVGMLISHCHITSRLTPELYDGSAGSPISRARTEAQWNRPKLSVRIQHQRSRLDHECDGRCVWEHSNSPTLQTTPFATAKARFIRFTALLEINTNGWTSAAEISVLPAGFDSWRRDLGLQTNGPQSGSLRYRLPVADGLFPGR